MIPDEIKAGIELLDEEVPNWRKRIDLDVLDMSDCYRCILGQLFGEYMEGKGTLGLDYEADEYGFDIDPTGYTWLTKAWKEALS